jgi:predicted XRE-type DNA-binding protein
LDSNDINKCFNNAKIIHHDQASQNDRVEELMAGDIDRFQVELLITMLSHAGMRVRVEIVATA